MLQHAWAMYKRMTKAIKTDAGRFFFSSPSPPPPPPPPHPFLSFFPFFSLVLFVCSSLNLKQNKTKQNKTKQNKTKQNKPKQNKTNIIIGITPPKPKFCNLRKSSSRWKEKFSRLFFFIFFFFSFFFFFFLFFFFLFAFPFLSFFLSFFFFFFFFLISHFFFFRTIRDKFIPPLSNKSLISTR